LLPASYRPSIQNFQPMVKVVTSIAGSVNHALAVILGDQGRATRDVSNKVLPALDARGNRQSSSPGFMKIWCDFFPNDFGWYIQEQVQQCDEFNDLETYEGYTALWLRYFEFVRKRAVDISAENVTMHFYTDSKSHKSPDGGFGGSASARTNPQADQDPSTPKRFTPHRFTPSRPGVSSMYDKDESGCDLPDNEVFAEDFGPLKAVHSYPTSIQTRPSMMVRTPADAKAPGLGPCYAFVRNGLCENRACNFSHDPSLARVAWKGLMDRLMSSPYSDKSYIPRVSNVPTIVAPKLAHMDGSDRILPEDVPVRYPMKSIPPAFGLGPIFQDVPHGGVYKTSASSGGVGDY